MVGGSLRGWSSYYCEARVTFSSFPSFVNIGQVARSIFRVIYFVRVSVLNYHGDCDVYG